jgi:hypothetical protein
MAQYAGAVPVCQDGGQRVLGQLGPLALSWATPRPSERVPVVPRPGSSSPALAAMWLSAGRAEAPRVIPAQGAALRT